MQSFFRLGLLMTLVSSLAMASGCVQSREDATQQDTPAANTGTQHNSVPREEAGQSNDAQRNTFGGGNMKPYEGTNTGTATGTTNTEQEDNTPTSPTQPAH